MRPVECICERNRRMRDQLADAVTVCRADVAAGRGGQWLLDSVEQRLAFWDARAFCPAHDTNRGERRRRARAAPPRLDRDRAEVLHRLWTEDYAYVEAPTGEDTRDLIYRIGHAGETYTPAATLILRWLVRTLADVGPVTAETAGTWTDPDPPPANDVVRTLTAAPAAPPQLRAGRCLTLSTGRT